MSNTRRAAIYVRVSTDSADSRKSSLRPDQGGGSAGLADCRHLQCEKSGFFLIRATSPVRLILPRTE
jgi:hypothetical protein